MISTVVTTNPYTTTTTTSSTTEAPTTTTPAPTSTTTESATTTEPPSTTTSTATPTPTATLSCNGICKNIDGWTHSPNECVLQSPRFEKLTSGNCLDVQCQYSLLLDNGMTTPAECISISGTSCDDGRTCTCALECLCKYTKSVGPGLPLQAYRACEQMTTTVTTFPPSTTTTTEDLSTTTTEDLSTTTTEPETTSTTTEPETTSTTTEPETTSTTTSFDESTTSTEAPVEPTPEPTTTTTTGFEPASTTTTGFDSTSEPTTTTTAFVDETTITTITTPSPTTTVSCDGSCPTFKLPTIPGLPAIPGIPTSIEPESSRCFLAQPKGICIQNKCINVGGIACPFTGSCTNFQSCTCGGPSVCGCSYSISFPQNKKRIFGSFSLSATTKCFPSLTTPFTTIETTVAPTTTSPPTTESPTTELTTVEPTTTTIFEDSTTSSTTVEDSTTTEPPTTTTEPATTTTEPATTTTEPATTTTGAEICPGNCPLRVGETINRLEFLGTIVTQSIQKCVQRFNGFTITENGGLLCKSGAVYISPFQQGGGTPPSGCGLTVDCACIYNLMDMTGMISSVLTSGCTTFTIGSTTTEPQTTTTFDDSTTTTVDDSTSTSTTIDDSTTTATEEPTTTSTDPGTTDPGTTESETTTDPGTTTTESPTTTSTSMFSIPVTTPSATTTESTTVPDTCGTCKYNNPCETITDITKVQGRCFAGFCLISDPSNYFHPIKCSGFKNPCNSLLSTEQCDCTIDTQHDCFCRDPKLDRHAVCTVNPTPTPTPALTTTQPLTTTTTTPMPTTATTVAGCSGTCPTFVLPEIPNFPTSFSIPNILPKSIAPQSSRCSMVQPKGICIEDKCINVGGIACPFTGECDNLQSCTCSGPKVCGCSYTYGLPFVFSISATTKCTPFTTVEQTTTMTTIVTTVEPTTTTVESTTTEEPTTTTEPLTTSTEMSTTTTEILGCCFKLSGISQCSFGTQQNCVNNFGTFAAGLDCCTDPFNYIGAFGPFICCNLGVGSICDTCPTTTTTVASTTTEELTTTTEAPTTTTEIPTTTTEPPTTTTTVNPTPSPTTTSTCSGTCPVFTIPTIPGVSSLPGFPKSINPASNQCAQVQPKGICLNLGMGNVCTNFGGVPCGGSCTPLLRTCTCNTAPVCGCSYSTSYLTSITLSATTTCPSLSLTTVVTTPVPTTVTTLAPTTTITEAPTTTTEAPTTSTEPPTTTTEPSTTVAPVCCICDSIDEGSVCKSFAILGTQTCEQYCDILGLIPSTSTSKCCDIQRCQAASDPPCPRGCCQCNDDFGECSQSTELQCGKSCPNGVWLEATSCCNNPGCNNDQPECPTTVTTILTTTEAPTTTTEPLTTTLTTSPKTTPSPTTTTSSCSGICPSFTVPTIPGLPSIPGFPTSINPSSSQCSIAKPKGICLNNVCTNVGGVTCSGSCALNLQTCTCAEAPVCGCSYSVSVSIFSFSATTACSSTPMFGPALTPTMSTTNPITTTAPKICGKCPFEHNDRRRQDTSDDENTCKTVTSVGSVTGRCFLGKCLVSNPNNLLVPIKCGSCSSIHSTASCQCTESTGHSCFCYDPISKRDSGCKI